MKITKYDNLFKKNVDTYLQCLKVSAFVFGCECAHKLDGIQAI